MLLNGGQLDGKRYLSGETCRLFTTTVSRISRRALGFDKPDKRNPRRSPCALATPGFGVRAYGLYGNLRPG